MTAIAATRYKIYLRLVDRVWHAIHTNPDIIAMMGTNEIPTAYLIGTPKIDVARELQRLNPDCDIILT